MSDVVKVPLVDKNKVEIDASKSAGEGALPEELLGENIKEIVQVGKDNTIKYSSDYSERASELDKRIRLWGGLLVCVILIDILYFTWFSNITFKYSLEYIKDSLKISATNSFLKPSHMLWIFYLTKILPSLFLVGLTYWIAKIYNQLRRLSITYKDKAIIANIFEKLVQRSDDPNSQKLVREYALKEIFALSLEQAEKSTPKTGDINTKFELNR